MIFDNRGNRVFSWTVTCLRSRGEIGPGLWAALAAAGFLAVLPARPAAGLDITTDITADATWTLADSPVRVHIDPFVVDTNATLTIEPGVTVHFTNGYGSGFKVYGQLRAVGTPAQRIKFESWGPDTTMGSINLQVRGTEPMKTNLLCHVDLTNLSSFVYFWGRVATLADCRMAIQGNVNWGVRGYCNLGTTPGAMVRLQTNEIRIVTTYSSTGASGYGGLLLDGYPAELRDNQITVTPVGELSHFFAVSFDVSNTTAFDALVAGNTITACSDLATNNQDATGILCDSSVRCTISNCTVSVQGRGHLTGISKTDTNRVVGNTVTLTTTNTTSFANVYGIDFQCAGAGHDDLVLNNRVTINSGSRQQFIYGLYVESGRIANNRVVINQRVPDSYVYGLYQIYYGGSLENNTILLNTTNDNRNYGLMLATHFNPSHEIRVYNNLIAQQIPLGSNAAAVYQDSECSAVVTNSHNLTYNFVSNFVGCAAGPGTLTNDPVFADADYRLAAGSPAVDSGTNQAWMAGAIDLDGSARVVNQVVDRGAFERSLPTKAQAVAVHLREDAGRVLVCWETAAEYATLGFHVERWDAGAGGWLRITGGLVPAQGWPQGGLGAAYVWHDAGALPGVAYLYQLVEVELSGREVDYGPFACSTLMPAEACLSAAPGGLVICWPGREGERYRVWKAAALQAAFVPLSTTLPATPPLNCFTDHAARANAAFYRVETFPAD